MDANGHLLNWISSQDGDKLGTGFFFLPSSPSQVILRAILSASVCGENVNEEGQGDAAGLKLSAPDGPPLPHNEGKKLRGTPCAIVSQQSQFSKVPASDVTCRLSNGEVSRCLLWFWYMQVAVGFCHSPDKLDGSQNLNMGENKSI